MSYYTNNSLYIYVISQVIVNTSWLRYCYFFIVLYFDFVVSLFYRDVQ